MRRFVLGILLVLAPSLLARDVLAPRFGRAGVASGPAAAQPPLRASETAAPLLLTTRGASPSDLAELRAANAGNGPMHAGIVREVQPVAIASALGEGRFRWRGSVRAEGAHRVRMRLDGVELPEGARLWVYGAGGEAIAIDRALVQNGTLWTPSVAGELATIEIDAPRAAAFRITGIADVRARGEVAAQSTECISDLSCHSGVDPALSRAISFYDFIAGTHLLACTGSLLNNAAEDGTPYFLTANHCVKTQEQAATIEALWDYRSSACNGPAPDDALLPRTNGATLLVTSATSDVTLLRLGAIPPNRTFLGWDARVLDAGTLLFHISHPNGDPQRYSTSVLELTDTPTCAASPRPSFHYSRPVIGATDAGSSGSPVMTGNGLVVGQLKSGCGPEPANACNRANYEVDGAFSTSFPLLKAYLDPGPACEACTPGATTACMLGNRFKVTMHWVDPVFGSGSGKPIRFAENTPQIHPDFGPILESAYFAFYDFFPNSVESVVKMTRGVGINNRFWVFVTGFTGASYDVTVQDTQTCATWQRSIAANATEVVRDYEAFAFP